MSAISTYLEQWRGLVRLGFVLCLILIAILSWTPGDDLQRTGLPGGFEHFIAYAITAFVAGFASRERRVFPQILLLCIYAGVMEFGQLFVPLRQADALDFVASSMGVVVGSSLAWIYLKLAGPSAVLREKAR